MSKIIFKHPSKDTPGFLLRTKKALEFKEHIDKKEVTPQLIDEMVGFLLPYITEPVDREEARTALFEASEEQFGMLVEQFSGGSESKENPTLPAKNETS